jgi:hypothetical protein
MPISRTLRNAACLCVVILVSWSGSGIPEPEQTKREPKDRQVVMARVARPLILLFIVVAIGACTPDPRQYETEPVKVKSDKGIVTCQLYTDEIVIWDRAIDRPSNMTIQDADAICRALGERRQKGG